MKKKKIAVIVCTYEPNEFLYEQIKSIDGQVDVDVDVHIYDDGSLSDSSNDILLNLESKVFNLHRLPASGMAGKNFLRAIEDIDIEKYDFLALSDQDDIWLADKLKTAVDKIEEYKVDGYSSDLVLYDGEKSTGILTKSKRQTRYDFCFQGASAGCTYVLTKKLTHCIKKRLKLYDYMSHRGRLSHDWLVYYVCRSMEMNWFMDDHAKILYRQHNHNVYGAKRSVSEKIKMVLGSWYKENIYFVSRFSPENLKLEVDMPRLSRLKFMFQIFEFRRERLYSFVCYLLWLMVY